MLERRYLQNKICQLLQTEYVALLGQRGSAINTFIQTILICVPPVNGMKFISVALPRNISDTSEFTELFIEKLITSSSQVPPEGSLKNITAEIIEAFSNRSSEYRLRKVLDILGQKTTATYLVIVLHALAEVPEAPLKSLLLTLREYHDQMHNSDEAGEKLRFLVLGDERLWHLCFDRAPDRSPFNIAQRILIDNLSLEEIQATNSCNGIEPIKKILNITSGVPSLVEQVINRNANLDNFSSFFSFIQDNWNLLPHEAREILQRLSSGLEHFPNCSLDYGCPQIPEISSLWKKAFWAGFLRVFDGKLIWRSMIHETFVAQQLLKQTDIRMIADTPDKLDLKTERDQVFISYSHKDKKWLQELKTMLAPLVRKQTVLAWDDSQIDAGSEWRKEIENALNSAKIAVLLVSPNFLASEFIAERELPQLLKAAKEEGLIVLWIHISYTLYKETEIEIYQAAHDPSQPLSSLSRAKRDQVIVKICEKIQKAFHS